MDQPARGEAAERPILAAIEARGELAVFAQNHPWTPLWTLFYWDAIFAKQPSSLERGVDATPRILRQGHRRRARGLLEVVPRKGVVGVLDRLWECYRDKRRGPPDLIVLDPSPGLVETKGPKDRLTPEQAVWLRNLAMECGGSARRPRDRGHASVRGGDGAFATACQEVWRHASGPWLNRRIPRKIIRTVRNSPLDALLPRSRRGILSVLLSGAVTELHLSEIARRIGVPPSSLQRELAALSEAGILTRRRDGNRVAYGADESCPFLPELRGLINKTVGMVGVLREALEPLSERLTVVFVYGSAARGAERPGSDVDVLLIGTATPREVSRALASTRATLGREVNASVFTPQEFRRRVKEKRPFPCHPLDGERVFAIGTQGELDTLAGAKSRHGPATRPRGGQ